MALRQDPALAEEILEYRAAVMAVEWMNEGPAGIEKFKRAPSLMGLLKAMHDAQGIDVTEDLLFREMAANTRDDDDED